jgi:hypothetical protein
MRVFEEVEIKIQLSVLDEAFLFENRQRLVDSVGVKPSSDSSASQAMQLLMECVEDLAIEKVRFAQVSAGKTATGATRLRGEGEVKRLQSANAIVLLTENVRRLSETVGPAAKEQEINATVFETIRA